MAEEVPSTLTAIELRKAGMQPSEIAETLSRSEEDIQEEIHIVLRDKATSLPDDEVMLELERLDTLTKAQWVGAIQGDKSKIRTVMDLQQRRLEVLAEARSEDRPAPGRALNTAVTELYRKIGARHAEDSEQS